MKLIRITAMWCMSCLVMKRVWDKTLPKEWEVLDYDFDEDKEIVEKYDVGKILPVVIIFSEGKEIKRIIGEHSKKEMINIVKDIIDEKI